MKPRALLIFADSAQTDCQRRGWPSAFRVLLEAQIFQFSEEQGIDIHLFTSPGHQLPGASTLHVHSQEGISFGQRLENAIECLARLGYQEIVIVGRDCPDLEQRDILTAFGLLRQHRVVLGPDHRGGCYLIAFHVEDREKLHGIRWQRNTDFHQIKFRFGDRNLRRLPVKLDLDSLSDVWLLAGSTTRLGILSSLLRDFLLRHPARPTQEKWNSSTENQREHWQFPPPPFRVSLLPSLDFGRSPAAM